jgi:hypothetical protein
MEYCDPARIEAWRAEHASEDVPSASMIPEGTMRRFSNGKAYQNIDGVISEVGGPDRQASAYFADQLIRISNSREDNWSNAEIYALLSALICAIPFALISAIPWFWYFLLARIEELAAAIRGNRP